MIDRNAAKTLWFGVATVVALLVSVGCQLYAGQADGQAKHAACEQARGWLPDYGTGPVGEHAGGGDRADERR